MVPSSQDFIWFQFLGYKEIFDRKIEQIRSWKEANPVLYVHAEMGAFHKSEIMEYLLERLPVDSLGMNEDELARVMSLKPGWRGTMEAVQQLRERLGLSRVAVHTSDYIISAMKGLIPPEREVEALTRGADAAAALAATGSITGLPPTEVNPAGIDTRDEFLRDGAVSCGRGAYMNSGGGSGMLGAISISKAAQIHGGARGYYYSGYFL